MPGTDFQIGAETVDGQAVIYLSGEIDGRAAPDLVREFTGLMASGGIRELRLDLEEVSFIDSVGLRAIIEVERSARAADIVVQVSTPPPGVIDLLRTTGINRRVTLGPQPEPSDPVEFIERIQVELPRHLRAAAQSRAEVREALRHIDRDELAAVTLLTSEVVTNAVVHSGPGDEGTIELLITVGADSVAVQVMDPGPGFDPHRPPPRPPDRGGRGLLLVDHLSTRWGAAPSAAKPGWFTVWFELDLGTISLADATPIV